MQYSSQMSSGVFKLSSTEYRNAPLALYLQT
jgi:hypothetical protein